MALGDIIWGMYYSLLVNPETRQRLKVVICVDEYDMDRRRLDADRNGLIAFSRICDDRVGIPTEWAGVPVEESTEEPVSKKTRRSAWLMSTGAYNSKRPVRRRRPL